MTTTRLTAIRTNSLALTCRLCGHTALVPVSSIIDARQDDMTVQHAVSIARCSACGAKGHADYRILFEGGSFEALQGTRR